MADKTIWGGALRDRVACVVCIGLDIAELAEGEAVFYSYMSR